ncbi:MAG: hypothetical protein FD127_4405, partial [Acidimicrobiaceae bacterium]
MPSPTKASAGGACTWIVPALARMAVTGSPVPISVPVRVIPAVRGPMVASAATIPSNTKATISPPAMVVGLSRGTTGI